MKKNNTFAEHIASYLNNKYGKIGPQIFNGSPILQYIAKKTKSANKGAKSRGSFSNLYAIYVLVEDYINKGFVDSKDYKNYEGAIFTQLLKRQRELPFGEKLQNHSLNTRMNEEFKKFFSTIEVRPIIRNVDTSRYWFNENFLLIPIGDEVYNIAEDIINLINDYISWKQDTFMAFIEKCEELQHVEDKDNEELTKFILSLLAPNADARLFEITSFAILKYYYHGQSIFWGYSLDDLNKENLHLYKTGRTNANDGGIDFVMKPLGRFFQVTETLDFKKYFLDIEKIERYPITFVIKTTDSVENTSKILRENALKDYGIVAIVDKYLSCIEEIINIPTLIKYFDEITKEGYTKAVLDEIIQQSRVEFNLDSKEDEEEDTLF